MIYNINLGIGWASSGVEYAQSYRANILRRINCPAKFIFTDMFPTENIEHMTKNIGFLDQEVIWLYEMATDIKTAPVSYSLENFLASLSNKPYEWKREGKIGKVLFGGNNFYTVYFVDDKSDLVHRVEMVSEGKLIRKDYFTYCRIYSEYYAPLDNKAHLYQRRFFNEDGSIAYEEIRDNDVVLYRMKDAILSSFAEFVGYMMRQLPLTNEDVLILDRTSDIGQAVIENAKPAKVGIIIHADHFSENNFNANHILWNNYYEYPFSQHEEISFFVTATKAQKDLMEKQFQQVYGTRPVIYNIPVGSLDQLTVADTPRKKHSIITASRLATEKHIDWAVKAVVKAHDKYEDISFDIYGKGAEAEHLEELIRSLHAEEYIHLMGQHKLDQVYKKYEVYLSASMSEGFGLTLLEAVGSGLPIIGFDVRYGNQTFILEDKNGYRIPVEDRMDEKQKVEALKDRIERLFEKMSEERGLNDVQKTSYDIAGQYLTSEVEAKWAKLIKDMTQ